MQKLLQRLDTNTCELPNLLVIGAAKSGTSALHAFLGQHPEIFMTTPKEPRFFIVWDNLEQMKIHERENRIEHNYFCTIERYRTLFEGGRHMRVRGESSTAYLANPWCAEKIKRLIPDVKIIAILRNPVDRAFSNYVMYKNWRKEKMRFVDAIKEEMRFGRASYPQPMQYLALGKYASSLKTFINVFTEQRVKVYLYDDFQSDPAAVLKNVFQFVGVDDSVTIDVQKKYNESGIRRYAHLPRVDRTLLLSEKGFKKLNLPPIERMIHGHRIYKPTLHQRVRELLVEYFNSEVCDLEKLIGRDLTIWKS